MKKSERVVVLGASNKPDRYSYKAIVDLTKNGHEVIPVNPGLDIINGIKVTSNLNDVEGPVDTITLYLGPERLKPLIDDIIRLKPNRIISNPGTETPQLKEAAEANQIPYVEACTLVMLATNQF